MALNYDSVKNFTAEQKEAIALLLSDMEENEPLGPGVSNDYVKEMREVLSLKKPTSIQLNSSPFYVKLCSLTDSGISFKVHDLLNSNGDPVLTITASTRNLDKLL